MFVRWLLAGCFLTPALAPGQTWWDSPDRAAKVAALIPGRGLPAYTPATLFADYAAAQLRRWEAAHGPFDALAAAPGFAASEPDDDTLQAAIPEHIAPFGRPRDGQPDAFAVEQVLIKYCPFCGARTFSLTFSADDRHAATGCCRRTIQAEAEDYPAGDPLRPTTTVGFAHLDGTTYQAACTIWKDPAGTTWELFLPTIFAQRRWLRSGSDQVVAWAREFDQTADPRLVHKIAATLDRVADVYYGLPLCYRNKLAVGKDGQPLTRAEWESVPRPAIFETSYLGGWNRRTPIFNQGWINMSGEDIWVEPFARVRHHPAFQAWSQRRYGDPEALDRKVREKLLADIALMYQTVFSQKLLTNYQEANYAGLWLLGILVQDPVLLDFAGPAQEVAIYNHTYQDGLNGEGAPNYMAMPGGYFYPYLQNPKGWLELVPDFLSRHPFVATAASEMYQLTTARGMPLEFGDQHQYAWPPVWQTDSDKVAELERRGSRNWAGYGVGVIRVGGPAHRLEVGLGYTRASLHNAHDALSLEAWFDGVPVMRRGGYAAHWSNAPLDFDRTPYQVLANMGYPHTISEAPTGWDSWTWSYVHNTLCQNTVLVDGQATGGGWGDNRGYGEVIAYRGGEPQGTPGSGLQVLDVVDHYSWQQVGRDVPEFRRTLLGIEGPDGRGYVIDRLQVTGGRQHALLNSAWAERADDRLPKATVQADHLAAVLFGPTLPDDTPFYRDYRKVTGATTLAPADQSWDLTWQQDLGQWAPREPDGRFRRPIPEDQGKVRMRLRGLDQGDGRTRLVRAGGPWVGWLKQPLPDGQRVDGYVVFEGARDFLVELRQAADDRPLRSSFVHVLEGFRDGESSALAAVAPLVAESVQGAERDWLALQLRWVTGEVDQVIWQSAPGALRLPDGLETDARYAMVRRGVAGEVEAVELVAGTFLRADGMAVTGSGTYQGGLVDIIGDLTGTRQESALVAQSDAPWPGGPGLEGRQLLVQFQSELREPSNEGWRIAKAEGLPNGRTRFDLQDHAPLATSWHQVTELPADRPDTLRTWRPMVDHGNSPWYRGLAAWFPERGKTYRIQSTNAVGGGYGGDTLTLVGGANLAADGIRVGDWYVIYGVEPGCRVTVHNDLSWRREPSAAGRLYALRATGTVTVRCDATRGPLAWRVGARPWLNERGGRADWESWQAGQTVQIACDLPDGFNLQDDAPPRLVTNQFDGRDIGLDPSLDLGWIEPPQVWSLAFEDEANDLDAASLTASLNGVTVTPQARADGPRKLRVRLPLAELLALDAGRPRRQRLEVSVADRSLTALRATCTLTFIPRPPLDPGAIYLSDLVPVRSRAHGGLLKDRDYVGEPAEIGDAVYPKCLTLCPETAAGGGWAEVVFALPTPALARFAADVGISRSSRGNGSVTFTVETGPAADGPWTIQYRSPTIRGGHAPTPVEVTLAGAAFLRLSTTDGGDNINSDHAVWGAARLLP